MESQTRNRRGSLHPHALPATATEEHSSGHQRTPSRDHRKKALKPASNGEMSDDRLAAPSSDTRRVSDTSSNQEMVRSLTEAVQKAPVKEAMTLVNTMANRQSHDTDGPRRARGHKGILSNLLQLYGAQDGATERLGSKKDDQEEDIIHRNKMNRRRSIVLDMDEELDEVAATKKRKEEEAKAKFLDNKKRRASMMGRRRSVVLDADELVDIVKSKNKPPDKSDKPSGKEIEYEIAAEVADQIARQNIILKLGKALMSFGAPSHRLEPQLVAAARALKVDAQFVHLPAMLIVSFGDPETRTSETHFVKASGELSLGALHNVHEVYRQIVHHELELHEGSAQLTRLLKQGPPYGLGLRVCFAGLGAFVICMLSYGGSPVDALVTGLLGATLKYLNLRVAKQNPAYGNIFEISGAMIIAFFARALANTGVFCYQAIAGASIVSVLPGYVILCGALELGSRNIIAGSVRIVWALIYSTFVGFGIIVGSDIYFVLNPQQHAEQKDKSVQDPISLGGSFLSNVTYHDVIQAWDGVITYLDSKNVDASLAANKRGSVYCYREPDYPWWQQKVPIYWAALFVPVYAVNSCVSNLATIRSRQFPVMIFIGCVGWVINKVGNMYIFNRSDVVSFLGAMAVGLLGNLYSRVFKGTAFTAMAPGVLFLVPTGIAAAGGLAEANTANTSEDNVGGGLMIGFRIVQVAIGITVGLFFSSFLVYSVASRRNKGNAVFAF